MTQKSLTFDTYLIDSIKVVKGIEYQSFALVKGLRQLKERLQAMKATYLNGEPIGDVLELKNKGDLVDTWEFKGNDGNDILIHKFVTFAKAKATIHGMTISIDYADKESTKEGN